MLKQTTSHWFESLIQEPERNVTEDQTTLHVLILTFDFTVSRVPSKSLITADTLS